MRSDFYVLISLIIGASAASISTGESLLVWQSLYSLSAGVMIGWILRRMANANNH